LAFVFHPVSILLNGQTAVTAATAATATNMLTVVLIASSSSRCVDGFYCDVVVFFATSLVGIVLTIILRKAFWGEL